MAQCSQRVFGLYGSNWVMRSLQGIMSTKRWKPGLPFPHCWVHVRKDTKQKFAFQAGRKTDGDKSVVSELRFSQLQNSKTPDEFLRRMRRILKQINGEVSVEELGNDIEQWFFEHNQFRPRKAEKRISVRWAMDYYRAATLKK
jgi:CRISPR system Cascade subunit CasB